MKSKGGAIIPGIPGILGPRKINCNLGISRSGVGLSVLGLTSRVASELIGGKVMSKSLVWLTLVRPGLGSKAGIKAENLRLITCSSSQAFRLKAKRNYLLIWKGFFREIK